MAQLKVTFKEDDAVYLLQTKHSVQRKKALIIAAKYKQSKLNKYIQDGVSLLQSFHVGLNL